MRRIAIGVVIGVLGTFGVLHLTHYVRHLPYRDSQEIERWAYLHVPKALERGGFVSMLNVQSSTVGQSPAERGRGESMHRVQLVYEILPGGIRVIRTICRLKDGKLVSPSDDKLRSLNEQADTLPVSSEPLPLPK